MLLLFKCTIEPLGSLRIVRRRLLPILALNRLVPYILFVLGWEDRVSLCFCERYTYRVLLFFIDSKIFVINNIIAYILLLSSTLHFTLNKNSLKAVFV